MWLVWELPGPLAVGVAAGSVGRRPGLMGEGGLLSARGLVNTRITQMSWRKAESDKESRELVCRS